MKLTKADFLKGAARWKAMKTALIDISQSNGSEDAILEAVRRCFPDYSWEEAEKFLITMAKQGYITGLEISNKHVILPVTIRLTKSAEEYFEDMAAEALMAAGQ